MRPVRKFLLLAIFCLISVQALAGAWTQGAHKTLLITSLTYYQASRYYDDTGREALQAHYNKTELRPYFEHGMRDWLTLGGSVSLQYAQQKPASNFAIGDSEFFGRVRLWQGRGLVFSLAPFIKLPRLVSMYDAPTLGSSHPDGGITGSAGYSFEAFGYHHYAALEASYRHRFGPSHDQLRLEATLGVRVHDKLTLMPQLFVTRRLGVTTASAFTQSSGDDYDALSAQFSVLYDLTENTAVQLGAFKHLQGRNSGKGSGVVLALWRTF